ncbi:MAG: hypothetical protein LBB12_03095 [Holosporaceae bacterium]|jgi:hypothetical protein|nr:hypothetical protein [Holosporaceae bacterium]
MINQYKIIVKFMTLLKKYRLEIILIIAGLIASFMCYARVHFFVCFFGDYKMHFFDTDDYITLVRIRDFFTHYDLANSVIARANVPFGGDLHWTRFYDFFLIIPSYILNFFLDSINDATEYVGFFIAPFLKSITIIIVFKLFQKIMSRTAAFLATFAYAVNVAINYSNMFGRPDHHALILLFLCIYLYFITVLAESNFQNSSACLKSAVASAICVWISPETLIILLLAEAMLFLFVHQDTEKLKMLYRKNMITSCSIGVIIFLFCPFSWINIFFFGSLLLYRFMDANKCALRDIGIFVFLIILYSAIPQAEYDKISTVHLVLYICISACFKIAQLGEKYAPQRQTIFALFSGGIMGIVYLLMFPKFLYGLDADISEALRKTWLETCVDELKSPFAFGANSSIYFSIHLIMTCVAIYGKISDLIMEKRSSKDVIWWILITCSCCYMFFASCADRMRATSVFLSMPLIVEMGMNGVIMKMWPRFLKIFMTCAIAFCPEMVQKYQPILSTLIDGNGKFQKICSAYKEAYQHENRFFKFLNDISVAPSVILTYLGKSSLTLYYTKHKVVGIPYHRQEKGILSYFAVIEKEYNEEIVKKILYITQTSYIFISKHAVYANPSARTTFAGMIAEGKYPDWISIVNIPAEFNDVILARVDQIKLKQSFAK